MPAKDLPDTTRHSFKGAFSVIGQSLTTIRHHPQLLVYPYTALLFITITYPIVSVSFFAGWYDQIFTGADTVAPDKLTIIFGLVGFSVFYTAFVSAYFSCAVSAAVLAILQGKKPSMFYGVGEVAKHFFRVTKFAILAVFFLPMGIYAQRRKLPRGIVGVIGSSLTLHMAQVAPSILTTNQKYGATIRDSVDKLGKTWREGLILKIGMYLMVFLVVALPQLINHQWYKGQTASDISWLLSLELGVSSYMLFKVINSIFTTVLYHRATQVK